MTGGVGHGKHLVHGMGTGLEAPTWPVITVDEAEAVLAHFPSAGPLEGLRWHSPRPFSAATLIGTRCGDFVLKRHHLRVRTPAGLAEEHAFIAYLGRMGLTVPEIMQTKDGASAIATDGWSYELHRSADGADLYRDRQSWTPFFTCAHARAAGAELARLHRASYGFDAPARRPQPLVASFSILPAADPMAAARAYVDARPALAAFLSGRSWQRQLGALLAALGEGLPVFLADEEPLWTHNDWHPSNLLWAADGDVRTAFDFGLSDRSCALHDLATAIERSAVEWLHLGQRESIADPQAARALIAGYRTIRPVDADKLARLLPLVHLEFALSEIDYFAGVLDDTASAMMAWEGYLIGHAEWFLSPAGRAFLREIAD